MAESETKDSNDATGANVPQAPDTPEEKPSLWQLTKKTTKTHKEGAKKKAKTYKEEAKKKAKEIAMVMVDKIGKPIFLWITKEPTVLHPGQHPEWPGYTGIGTELNFRLQIRMYDARTLVENTIASFFKIKDDRNLTPRQLAARRKIIQLFKKLEGQTTPFGTREVRAFLPLFDDFFFFGAMVNSGGPPRVYLHVWSRAARLATRLASPFYEWDMPYGFARSRHVRGYGPVSEIHIAGHSFYIDPVPLWFLMETLIHEMVHVYIQLFLCRCPTCWSDCLNTRGLDGHGQSFLMLIDCIDRTLRTWGIGLSGLIRGSYSHPCSLGDMCPTVGTPHEGKRHIHCDEIYSLHDRQRRLLEALRRRPESQVHSPPGEGKENQRRSEKANDTKEKKQEESKLGLAELNKMRKIGERVPGELVYMTSARAGATKVDESLLERTGDIVQALIKKAATEVSKKELINLNLPWPRIGNETKPREKQG
ncbi:hypothetical protein F4859DRAFT_521900 [Xylaria cf. heliscus]|nr:hypothetical protein F4859DRAFT_521900 [Xylaria cf. heliscus]